MISRRGIYLATAGTAVELMRAPELAAGWHGPSVLQGWAVSGLTGHLARAVTTVEQYLDTNPGEEGPASTPSQYYETALPNSDLESALHATIRRRGEEMAADGPAALLEVVDAGLLRLRNRLPAEPPERRVVVLGGVVMTLDDYLATRVVELVVHMDDLSLSLGVGAPEISDAAFQLVTSVLLETALHRHGQLAVVRAMARRERDAVSALRVF